MGMAWVAVRMLTGDPAKYNGLIFGIAFASMLMAQQLSIFCGLMLRTASQIRDIDGADVWVMDSRVQCVDEVRPLRDDDVYRVRGVPGVDWAVRLFKGQARVRVDEGDYRVAVLLGLDDASLVGAPKEMLVGAVGDLHSPDAVIMDEAGYKYLWPGEPIEAGKTVEMNDHRAVVVGVCKASPPFQTFPVVYTRFSQAIRYVASERNTTTFVLAGSARGQDAQELCRRIRDRTGLQALTREQFIWKTIWYYVGSTGIPVNFGITVALGFIVGAAVSGQTFYLFTLENLKLFGTLKAMGVTNLGLLGMVSLQGALVGVLGYAVGVGMAALFFVVTGNLTHLRGFFIPWQVLVGTGAAVLVIVFLATLLSIRRVWVVEPAVVFKG